MNFLFGIGVALATFFCSLVLAWMLLPKVEWKTKFKIISIVTVLSAIPAFMTYGPRVELRKAQIPTISEHKEIKRGAELVPHDDRWKSFQDKIDREKERQDNEQ